MEPDELGWDAIDRALADLYGTQEPMHFGTARRYAEGGPDPLDGISVYPIQSPPHWHFVTFGFSEVGLKESSSPDVSGWGFELTLRLATQTHAEGPPVWALMFLQKLGRFVFKTGERFSEWDFIDMGGTITGDEQTALTALVFVPDPQLKPIQSVNGRLSFLQVVGVTAAEFEWVRQHGVEPWANQFRGPNPLLITELGRMSTI